MPRWKKQHLMDCPMGSEFNWGTKWQCGKWDDCARTKCKDQWLIAESLQGIFTMQNGEHVGHQC